LYPFKELMKQGLGSVMVAHLSIPALDTTANQPSTLTKKIVTGLLKDTLGFKGLVFTDALNMKGVSKFYKPGEINVKALIAGNDVLLFPEDVPQGIKEIKAAIERGEITQEEIDKRCMKILMVKQWVGLNHYSKIKVENITEELNSPQADLINRKLTEASITLLQNKRNIIPLKKLDTLKIASLSLGYKELNSFQKTLENYSHITHYGVDKDAKQQVFDTVLLALQNYNLVIINLNNTNNKPDKDFGLTDQVKHMLKAVLKQNRVIINIPANPYILAKIDSLEVADGIIMSYEDTDLSASYAAQLIFGGIGSKGKLPITPTPYFKVGMGIETTPIRMKYTIPEELGIDSKKFEKIDSIVNQGIKDKVFPGCQVLIAKDQKVIYQKSFGYHTYENKIAVKNDDLYDIASITKIVSSTASVMRLMDQGKIVLENKLSDYLPELIGTNKQDILIKEMLTHQAGFRDWIPFWQKTVNKDGSYKPGIYSRTPNEQYIKRVADDLYINNNYEDSLYKQIIESPIKERGKYLYSDLGYYFLKKVIEKQSGAALNIYTLNSFYAPLGLRTIGYKPLSRFDMDQIVPTEFDAKFRKQLLHGDVHDPGAAMLGGVAGHAGIFSDANDVAIMMQLFLNKGTYGGARYIDSLTLSECTSCQYKDNRRAIGFDKPETNPTKESPVCTCVSDQSFGHTGFTGTLAWADPKNGTVYIFLSNRVYPDADDNKLAKSGIRTKIQEIIYNALK
ncbi:MAG TPA: serine hydrolase, partial [Bacteroidia bacterium]|nr:serine hydrolase [Bacteroidia bacterium]